MHLTYHDNGQTIRVRGPEPYGDEGDEPLHALDVGQVFADVLMKADFTRPYLIAALIVDAVGEGGPLVDEREADLAAATHKFVEAAVALIEAHADWDDKLDQEARELRAQNGKP